MSDLRKAAEMALEALEELRFANAPFLDKAMEALRQALAQPEQEQKTPLKVLNLTVFTENRLRNGRVYDVETLQAMTNRDILAIPDMGKKALKEVMEALDVYAVNMSQECVDEMAKRGHEPALWLVQYKDRHEFVWGAKPVFRGDTVLGLEPFYTAPPSIEAAVLAEREACAKVLEGISNAPDMQAYANAIRARNEVYEEVKEFLK